MLGKGFEAGASAEVLSQPDRFLEDSRNLIKNSRNVTISRFGAPTGGGEWILRRLNYGKAMHQWRDMFRSGRASRALKNAWRLEAAGVRTPRALAATEVRLGRWPRRAYLITEAVAGAKTLEELLNRGESVPPRLVRRLAGLIARLHRAGYSHRDLKATNVLIDHHLQPWLIDLDGIRGVWIGGRRRRLKDLARLAGAISGQADRWRRTVLRFWICYCRELGAPRDARRFASRMEKALKRL
jgi:tRNA A-37 threonylcarbamoyl transferase component Bud32